jgi:hypothetical protein
MMNQLNIQASNVTNAASALGGFTCASEQTKNYNNYVTLTDKRLFAPNILQMG